MSDDTARARGLAVRCDRAGTVEEILFENPASALRRGHAFTEILDTASVQDALTLLMDAQRGLLARPVQLQLQEHDDDGRLHVVACSESDGRLVLVGARAVADLPLVIDTLAPHSPEVQQTLHRLSDQARADVADDDVFSALSEANNELVGMHRELARANAELDQLNRRKDGILAMVAHDLRNPLGSVAGFGAALERQLDGVLDPTARLMLSRIQALSSRMLDLVDDLLDTAVIQNHTLRLELEPTDLHALLGDTVANHHHAAVDKGIDLSLHVGRPTVMAAVDDSRLAQVIDNLLSNAIKFSPADSGARVTVTCTTPDAGHVAIIISDQGAGLSAEDRERLFEPFARRSRPGTANERGTGLGLAITRSIVDAHGGHIDVDSEVGEGSTFTVTLPVGPSSPPPTTGIVPS